MTDATVKTVHLYDYPFLHTIECRLKMITVWIIFGTTVYANQFKQLGEFQSSY